MIVRLVWFVILGCCLLLVLPRPWTERILAENGPIEMPTAIAYFVAAMMLWFSSAQRRWHAEIPGTVLLIAGGLRELDFQARFTTGYAFSSKFFLQASTPLVQKTAVAAVLLMLASMFTLLVVYNWRRFLRAFQARETWAQSFALAVSLIFISTALDEMGGFLRRQYPNAIDPMFIMWVFEESLEALIPVLFATAIVQAAIVPAVERRHAA
jgi:hypothetical protein